MKIINTLRGGLGNQLFQWALTKSLEQRYNCEVYLDIKEFNYSNWDGRITKRKFDLGGFPNINFKLLDNKNISQFTNNEFIELNDNNFNPNNQLLNIEKNYMMVGYWQNHTFFENFSHIIKKELDISETLKKELYLTYPELNLNCVSLHIRRSDYLTSNGFHPVQTLSYYENALKTIGNYDNVLIFSDDIEWCKENLNFKNQRFIENNSSLVDLWLMSLCKHNITANSSFSWWGAWLNDNKNKKIIIPSKWFSYGDVIHMSPQEWIKL